MKIKLFFKNHVPALIVALIIGFLYLVPQLFFQWSLDDEFQGIYRTSNDDETYYMARAREIIDGHYLISNPYFTEYKNGFPMQVFLPDLLLALPAKLFNFDIYPLYRFYDFVLPAVMFFLTYWIFYLLIKERFWSIYLSSWIFLIQYYFSFNRPVSPQFIFIFALTFIWILLKIVSNTKIRSKWLTILAAVNFGFLFYIYPYFWTYFSVLLFLLIIYYWWQKNFSLLKHFLVIFISGYFIALPYFYQTWQASQLPFFAETLSRLGMINTYFPSGVAISFIGLLVLILMVYNIFNRQCEREIGISIFLIMAIAASVISFNQHLITGKNSFFSSHYDIISYFIILFSISYWWWYKKTVFWAHFPAVKITAIIFLLAIFLPIFYKNLNFDYNQAVKMQSWKQTFNWLNENTNKDDVIMANNDLSSYIPSYTHDNILFNSVAKLYFVGDSELLDRFVINNYWHSDFDWEFVKRKLSAVYGLQNKALAGRIKQQNKIRKLFNLPQTDLTDIYFPPQQVQSVLNYANLIQENDWIDSLKKYHVKYIIVENDEGSKFISNVSKFKFIELVYQDGSIFVYRVNNN